MDHKAYFTSFRLRLFHLVPALLAVSAHAGLAQELSYTLVDTMQDKCFDLVGDEITCPAPGEDLYGQDAQYVRTPAAYTDQGDGTVLDDNTGLVWQQTPENDRKQYTDAIAYCEALELGDGQAGAARVSPKSCIYRFLAGLPSLRFAPSLSVASHPGNHD